MSARRKSKLGHEEPEHDTSERWMASYMDMVTVLMCLFIVLFAMSTVDAKKFEELKNSLATGFGAVKTEKIDTAKGVVVPPEKVGDTKDEEQTDLQLAIAEVQSLESVRKSIQERLHRKGLEDAVTFEVDERGLTVRLVGSHTFFTPNSSNLTPEALNVLDAISPVLAATPYQLAIEAHADKHGSPAPFATDWELSTARATQVLRRMVENGGVPGDRIRATGFGSTRPLSTEESLAAYAMNRRADIVVLSDKPEGVRALIPELLERGANIADRAGAG